MAWAFAFHGVVRVLCGQNVADANTRRIALMSYLFEAFSMIVTYIKYGDDVMSLKDAAFLMTAPWAMVFVLLRYKENKKTD